MKRINALAVLYDGEGDHTNEPDWPHEFLSFGHGKDYWVGIPTDSESTPETVRGPRQIVKDELDDCVKWMEQYEHEGKNEMAAQCRVEKNKLWEILQRIDTLPSQPRESEREWIESILYEMLTEIHIIEGEEVIQSVEMMAEMLDGEDTEGGELMIRGFCSDFANRLFLPASDSKQEEG